MDEIKEVRQELKELENRVSNIAHDLDRIEERRDNDHAILLEIRDEQREMSLSVKGSVGKLHDRIDVIQLDKREKDGFAKGVIEERIRIAKYLGIITVIVGILAYLEKT